MNVLIKSLLSAILAIALFSPPIFAMENDKYKQITSLIEQQNIETAFAELKKVQESEKKLSAEALLLFGKLYIELERPSKAFSFFEKTLFASTQRDATAKAGMAISQIMLGNKVKAKKYAKEALNDDRDSVEAKIAYASAFEDELSLDEIDKLFLSAMKASGGSTFAGRRYVEALLRKNKVAKAESILKKTLIENSIDAPSLVIYSDIHWLKGKVEAAIRYRTDAENEFRKAGNFIKADQMVAWLNFEAVSELDKIEQKTAVPKIQDEELDTKPVVLISPTIVEQIETTPITSKPGRKAFEPLEKPEDVLIDTDKGYFTGSGTIVGSGKYILTNKHVIENMNYVMVRNGLGETRAVKSIVEAKNDDLAILELEKAFPSEYSFSIEEFQNIQTGEEIFVMGYPMASTFGSFHPTITTGIVSNAKGFGEMEGEFQITAKVHPGNSGGPIFDKQGAIVGVATGGIDKKVILDEDGFIPDGINYGVSTERILRFLKENQKINKSSYQYDAATLYKYMRSAVVFIVAQE